MANTKELKDGHNSEVKQEEDIGRPGTHDLMINGESFNSMAQDLPKGYYTSRYFLGSWFAAAMCLLSSAAGFTFVSPILSYINQDLGPDANIIWVALVYNLGLSVGTLLVGRITDLFGRRWFFIGASILGLLGSIVASTAQTIPTLIGGGTMIGLSAAAGLSYPSLLGELVPMKRRFLVNASVYILCILTTGLGAAVGTAFVLYTSAGWRWCYYLCIIFNSIAGISFYLFYHPPTFQMKWGNRSKMDLIRHFDYIGTILFLAGLTIILLGLSWGGTVYPWKSARVISFIVVGFVCLVIFTLWEVYAPLREPLFPMYLLKNKDYVASILLLGLGANMYYAFAIYWPQMVSTVYSNGDAMWVGWISSILGCGIIVGTLLAGVLGRSLGYVKWQCVILIGLAGVFLAATASCNPDTLGRAIAFVAISSICIGWNEVLVISLPTMCIDDQRHIGAASGFAGSARALISVIGTVIYSVALTSQLEKNIPNQVPGALTQAGLPPSSIPDFINAFTLGGSFDTIRGLTPAISAAGAKAFKNAYADSFSTIFLVSIAFSVLATAVSFFIPNVEEKMTDEIAATLHGRSNTIPGGSDAEAQIETKQ